MEQELFGFKSYYSEIIEAIIEVYGEKYKDIIKKRFNSILFLPYINKSGLYAHYNYLVDCKNKKLILEFLSNIGIDTSIYNIDNYVQELPKEINELCRGYLGYVNAFSDYGLNLGIGFKSLLPKYQETIFKDYSKVEFINFIRGKDTDKITEETLEEFSKTEEYREIYNLALKLDKIYMPLKKKMETYLEYIKEYKEYYEKEEERYKDILESKKIELYLSIKPLLRFKIKSILDKEVNIKLKADKLLESPLTFKSYIEFFSEEHEQELNAPNTDKEDKELIHELRIKYFESMGIKIDKSNKNYHELIQREDVKEIIPTINLANEISKLRNQFLEEANLEYITNSYSFKNIVSKMNCSETAKSIIYHIIKNNRICLVHGIDEQQNYTPLIFLTLRYGDSSIRDAVILHEIIHAIESEITKDNKDRCGFESNVKEKIYSPYPHKNQKRKYERLNEIITDMLSLEVRYKLFEKGIYFIQPKQITKKDASNYNTTKLQKDLLKPFIDKYKNLILEVRIIGNLDKLTDVIGSYNFEDLNDAIDYIDYLIEKGLIQKLESNSYEDEIVKEYYNQLERLNNIYIKMGIIRNKSNTKKLIKN